MSELILGCRMGKRILPFSVSGFRNTSRRRDLGSRSQRHQYIHEPWCGWKGSIQSSAVCANRSSSAGRCLSPSAPKPRCPARCVGVITQANQFAFESQLKNRVKFAVYRCSPILVNECLRFGNCKVSVDMSVGHPLKGVGGCIGADSRVVFCFVAALPTLNFPQRSQNLRSVRSHVRLNCLRGQKKWRTLGINIAPNSRAVERPEEQQPNSYGADEDTAAACFGPQLS
jgi:hypothetical protein